MATMARKTIVSGGMATKSPYPMVRNRECRRDDSQHNNNAERAITKKSGRAREFAIAKDAQNRDRQNRPGSAEQDRASNNGVITAHEFTRFTNSSCNFSSVRCNACKTRTMMAAMTSTSHDCDRDPQCNR